MAHIVQSSLDHQSKAGSQDHIIAKFSLQCLQLFTQFTSQLSDNQHAIDRSPFLFHQSGSRKPILTPDDWRDSHEQFTVWTRNLGVFASDRGSLDYRLASADDVRDGVVLLLQNLKDDQYKCLQLLETDRSIESQDFYDTSSDSSDSDDMISRTHNTASSPTRLAASELQIRIGHITEVVNKLLRLASIIRTSGKRSRMTRALAYSHVQDGLDITEQFEEHYLPQVLQHRFGLKGGILTRFIKAISLRRKHFMYQSRHQKRLAYNHNISAEVLQEIPKSSIIRAGNQLSVLESDAANQQQQFLEVWSDLNPPTIATTFRIPQPERKAPSRLTSGSAKHNTTNHAIPPPPRVNERATHFECPYCCTLIPTEKQKPMRWKEHIITDLQPYVCLEPDCPNPDILLESKWDWIEHQRWEHAMEWWCDGKTNEHDVEKFTTLEAFAQHMKGSHSKSISSQRIKNEISTAGAPSLTPFSCCPLCDFSVSEPDQFDFVSMTDTVTQITLLQAKLQKHIADEMLAIFLIALPEREDIDCPDVESASQGGKRSTILASSFGRSLGDGGHKFYTLEPRGDDLLTPSKWSTPDQEHTPLDVEETFFNELWNDVWRSPALQEGVRATYTGPANDVIVSHWFAEHRHSMSETTLARIVESLSFDAIHNRNHNIETAIRGSLEWLFECREYENWLNPSNLPEHHGLLWIKGKPGTGKSTIMKFLLSSAYRNMSDTVVISFFFHARGTEIEKSETGMFRTLLYQLMKARPELRDVFNAFISILETEPIQWTSELLRSVFSQTIEQSRFRSLICFIDAIDECGREDEARGIVTFFESVCQNTSSTTGIELRVCLSSRHYPTISIQSGLQIILENNNRLDILLYLENMLDIGQGALADDIRQTVLAKSNGIFLWVRLIVPILNQAYDSGSLHSLRKDLDASPNDLQNLYDNILYCTERLEREETFRCLFWVLFAIRPLTPQELCIATLIRNSESQNFHLSELIDVPKRDFKSLISAWSKGLMEFNEDTGWHVSFIHGSVGDYLLREALPARFNSSTETSEFSGAIREDMGRSVRLIPRADSGYSTSRRGVPPISRMTLSIETCAAVSHDQLKQYCQLYYESPQVVSFLESTSPLPVASSQDAADLRQLAGTTFPFLEYVTHNVLIHSHAAVNCYTAETPGVSQAEFLKDFPQSHWITIYNLLQRDEGHRYSPTVSMLYILADQDLPNLIRFEMDRIPCMDIPGERYGLPLLAAKEKGNKAALYAMLAYRPQGYHQDNHDDVTVPSEDNIKKAVDILLVTRTLDWKNGETPIKWAVDNDIEPVIKCLRATGKV